MMVAGGRCSSMIGYAAGDGWRLLSFVLSASEYCRFLTMLENLRGCSTSSQRSSRTYSRCQHNLLRRSLIMLFAVMARVSGRYAPASSRAFETSSLCLLRGGDFLEVDAAATSSNRTSRVFVAVGSNLGDRYNNIRRSVELLCQKDVSLVQTSFLYETDPMYVLDQPAFLNGAIEVETSLEPLDMLHRLKDIEATLGRDFKTVRNGPRSIDLDILLWETQSEGRTEPLEYESTTLQIPHPRIAEREFVLSPLSDLSQDQLQHPTLNRTVDSILRELERSDGYARSAVRVLPLPRSRFMRFNETVVMGILNVTPDSFSDGGRLVSVERAVEEAVQMVEAGAGIVDIGGESTRPGAKEVEIEEELKRTVPVIRRLREGTKPSRQAVVLPALI